MDVELLLDDVTLSEKDISDDDLLELWLKLEEEGVI